MLRRGVTPVAGILLPMLLLVTGLLASCGEPVATPEPVFLQAAGSGSMVRLVSDLAAAFAEQSPQISIDVMGQGTQFGLKELAAGRVDLALVAWLPADMGRQWRATAVARDGIAIIVHPSNALVGVGLLQLQDLFSGRIYEWQGLGAAGSRDAVQVVSREAGSGTREAFEHLVMGEKRVTPLAVVAPSAEAVVNYVAEHPEAVGYVSMGAVTPGVKVLSVEGEMPTSQSTQGGSYPLSHELWIVAAESPVRQVQSFLRFVQSPAGQEIVGRYSGRVR